MAHFSHSLQLIPIELVCEVSSDSFLSCFSQQPSALPNQLARGLHDTIRFPSASCKSGLDLSYRRSGISHTLTQKHGRARVVVVTLGVAPPPLPLSSNLPNWLLPPASYSLALRCNSASCKSCQWRRRERPTSLVQLAREKLLFAVGSRSLARICSRSASRYAPRRGIATISSARPTRRLVPRTRAAPRQTHTHTHEPQQQAAKLAKGSLQPNSTAPTTPAQRPAQATTTRRVASSKVDKESQKCL